ncbi:MAG: enoyl-CoA hydratase-related protein [Saprospiraceae bacterium]
MEFYKEINTTDFHNQTFAFLLVEEADHVLTITLNREKKRNALHPQMVNEIAYAFQYAHSNNDIWMIVFGAKGRIFCAGADLKAFAGFVEPNDSTIPQPEGEILMGELFNKVHKPTIAKITGDVYAGGFFFLAGATIAIAQDDVKFGLPEVKRGLYPFQVMASLMQVMPARKVVDWCIRGYNLPVAEAERYGLVTQVVKAEEMDAIIENIVTELKGNSPTAIRNGLIAYDHIQPKGEDHKYLFKILMETMQSKDGQEGLKAFREKRLPIWTGE